MFNDDVLEKIFTNKQATLVPIGYQSTMVSVFEEVLSDMREEKPDAKLSTLFTH